MTGPKPQLMRCRPAHDVRVLFTYDGLPVRCTLAFPSSFIRWHASNFNPNLYLRLSEYRQSAARMRSRVHPRLLIHTPLAHSLPEQIAPPSVLPLEPSLRHTIAVHLIRISVTSLIGGITVTATCALSLDRPVPDVGEHIVAAAASPRFCARCRLPHGRRSRPVSVPQHPMLLAVPGTSISPSSPSVPSPLFLVTDVAPATRPLDTYDIRRLLAPRHLTVRHTLPLFPFPNTRRSY
jgi:hypothetical protein